MVTLTYQERFRTIKGVFDGFTNRTLFTLQSQGVFDELVSPLKIGKESNVFVATKDGKKVIVKIYRMQNADFKNMFSYIRKDSRYDFLKNNRRMIILAWVQREYKNLLRAQKYKIKVPKPLGWKNNIIVEEFIGDSDGEVSLPLKDSAPEDPQKFLKDLLVQVKKLYKAGLIHGDLSSFNVLNQDGKPVLIDFSQTTLIRTPNSEELLVRDIKNIALYFKKHRIIVDQEKVLKGIVK
jgi:RIO kinase 1